MALSKSSPAFIVHITGIGLVAGGTTSSISTCYPHAVNTTSTGNIHNVPAIWGELNGYTIASYHTGINNSPDTRVRGPIYIEQVNNANIDTVVSEIEKKAIIALEQATSDSDKEKLAMFIVHNYMITYHRPMQFEATWQVAATFDNLSTVSSKINTGKQLAQAISSSEFSNYEFTIMGTENVSSGTSGLTCDDYFLPALIGCKRIGATPVEPPEPVENCCGIGPGLIGCSLAHCLKSDFEEDLDNYERNKWRGSTLTVNSWNATSGY